MGCAELASHSQRSACRRCHARKVKCHSVPGQPCSGCAAVRAECILREKRRRNRGPSKPDTLPAILPTPARSPVPALTPEPTRSSRRQQPQLDVEATPMDQRASPNTTTCIGSDSEVGRAAAALSSLQDARHTDVKRHLVEMLLQDDIDDRVMQKGVRIVYVGQEYSNINYLIRHRAKRDTVHHFPANEISRQYTSHELDRIPREAFVLPSSSVVDELLESYFRLVNPGFPILDENIFMSQYRNRDPKNPPSILVLQAALMVGAHVSRPRPERDELKQAFFRRAKMLFDARFEFNRDAVVQAALLLTWHSEGVEDIGANSYYWIGMAARTAQGLGMHRDLGPSTLIAHDKRLWRRLWWILVQFDTIVSLSYGRPPAISLDESDVPGPEDSDFDPGENVDGDFVIQQTNLCFIISKTIKERYGLKTTPGRKRAALVEADRSLASWMASLPRSLAIKNPFGEPTMSSWTTTLHILYNNFLILLHRPPPRPASMASVIKQDDMEICSAAASSMVAIFETVWAKNELKLMNAFQVDSLFTALVQLSAEMRATNPILAANAMQRFDSALEILRSLSEYWLNAEIVLRLFEDSSERMRLELRIGKSPPQRDQSTAEHSDSALDTDSQGGMQVDGWQDFIPSPITALQHLGIPSDQLDFANMYWEGAGFSPFTDMGLYQNPAS